MTRTFSKPARATLHCRHYDYLFEPANGKDAGPSCARGLDISAQGGTPVCMPRPLKPGCVSREEYSKEERQAWDKWVIAATMRTAIAVVLIPDYEKKDERYWGRSGKFACPNCDGGTVSWTRAASNGHIHMCCSTPNCCSLIQ